MSGSNIAGLIILILSIMILVGITVYVHGAYFALITWGFSVVMTSIIVFGVWLLDR